jgi:hypothetical protein
VPVFPKLTYKSPGVSQAIHVGYLDAVDPNCADVK